ncbi:MAG: S1 RNA-binding domain-containing protein, partial [Victivallales bacterium]|nr:S1 RNA-binding domain-containing protein [Victivallales bacterium]
MSNIEIDNMPSMDELLQKQEQTPFKEGNIYTGKIVAKNENGIHVDIGLKAESFVDKSELRKFNELNVGDEIDVYLERLEGENSTPAVNVRKAEAQKTWDNIVNNNSEGSLITGTITQRVKGGLIVDIGVEAFLPGSQVDIIPPKDLNEFVGNVYEFKIVKVNDERKNIVLSRREVIEA